MSRSGKNRCLDILLSEYKAMNPTAEAPDSAEEVSDDKPVPADVRANLLKVVGVALASFLDGAVYAGHMPGTGAVWQEC